MRTEAIPVIRTAAVALLAAIAFAPRPARAEAVLTTPPISRHYPVEQTLCCGALNAGERRARVRIEIRDARGGLVTAFGPVTLAPGEGRTWSDSWGSGAYCRFVTSGDGSDLRAVATYDDGGRFTTAIAAR